MNSWVDTVEREIAAREIFRSGEKILCAVSGGVDSMVMLHVLDRIAQVRNWQLGVAHFNHQLRGAAAAQDERLVVGTARRLKLPVFAGRGSVRAYATTSKQSIEMAARTLRHKFLARTAQSGGYTCVALAHHLDDQIELFFLRLFRGAGGEGLGGMKWRAPSPVDSTVFLGRPLLNQSRDAIEAYAKEAKIEFREDESNRSRDIPRNRIRQQLIPLIASWHPGAKRCIARSMDVVAAESQVVAALADAWLKDQGKQDFEGLPTSVQRRVLEKDLIRLGVATTFELVEELRLHPKTTICVGPDRFIERAPEAGLRLRVLSRASFSADSVIIPLGGEAGTAMLGDARIRWRVRRGVPKVWKDGRLSRREHFAREAAGSGLIVRHWRPGDRYMPVGQQHAKKLQDLFVDSKVPREERRERLVVTTLDGKILWVEGLRIADIAKVAADAMDCVEWRWARAKTSIAG